MSKVPMLRGLVEQRLTAAAEEIFGLVERTIAEYEEELCRSKEEHERQLLDAVFSPQLRLHRAELPQQHVCKEEEVLSDQQLCIQVRNSSLDREDPEPPQIKEELCTSQEGEQLVLKQETDTFMLSLTYEERDHSEGQTLNLNPDDDTLNAAEKESLANMPVITSVESEANSDHQLRRAESQDQKGGQHGDSGSARNAEPEPKKRQRKSRSHSNNVDNTNVSETDVQKLSVVKAEVPPEQQGWSSSLDQEDPDPPHIKEEQQQLWTSQEGEQLQGLQEADIKFPFTTVPEKSEEDDEEKAQSSQLHESQTEENREAERTGSDGEDCGGQEPARNSDPDSPLQPATHDKTSDSSESESETDDSAEWEETREPQTGLNPLPNNEKPVSDVGCNTGNTSVSSSECTGSFGRKKNLQKHSGDQTGEKPFSCSVCGKRYLRKKTLTTHMKLHSKEKCYTCSVCKASFCQLGNLVVHVRIHRGEKPFSCSVCDQKFALKQNLRRHLTVHTGEKPFSFSVCSKGFTQKKTLRQHLTVHTFCFTESIRSLIENNPAIIMSMLLSITDSILQNEQHRRHDCWFSRTLQHLLVNYLPCRNITFTKKYDL
ncbi:zinc finger and SCAN domain-containing protein 31-like [Etheostoma spectabile]|uniref:zinc finger and SCAN domain-containing protein 31-like n=1 Tax=Etheostoma spectabile TaxID=54343 RepID=UPI0013AF6EA9|nr:zinc finger and SCAN domain-containing protein 31-like [Etheostoma spectabile]